MNKKINIICSTCKGENVLMDAYAQWNFEKQEYELVQVFDKGHVCEDCGGECSLEEKEVL